MEFLLYIIATLFMLGVVFAAGLFLEIVKELFLNDYEASNLGICYNVFFISCGILIGLLF